MKSAISKETPFVSVYRNPKSGAEINSQSLNDRLNKFFGSDLESNDSYSSYYNQFKDFSRARVLSPDLVVEFLLSLAESGKKWSSIKVAYYAIKSHTDIEIEKKLLRNFKNLMFERDSSKVFAAPAPALSRRKLVRSLNKAELRDRVILSVGWFGSLRVSELISIRKKDLEKKDGYYVLTIPKSKNYKRGESYQKKLQAQAEKKVCPVWLLDGWLRSFRHDEYIFPGPSGSHLTRSAVHRIVKRVIGKEYSSHSLRSGSLTHSIERGATIEQQLNLTGHRSAQSLKQYNQSSIETNNAADLLY